MKVDMNIKLPPVTVTAVAFYGAFITTMYVAWNQQNSSAVSLALAATSLVIFLFGMKVAKVLLSAHFLFGAFTGFIGISSYLVMKEMSAPSMVYVFFALTWIAAYLHGRYGFIDETKLRRQLQLISDVRKNDV